MNSTTSTTKKSRKTETKGETPELTVLPLNYNGVELLKRGLPSWQRAVERCSSPAELMVVDNASEDASLDWLREQGVKTSARTENRILQSYNDVAQEIHSPWLMILNNDVLLDEDCFDPLLACVKSDPRALGAMPSISADVISEARPRRQSGRFEHGHLKHVDLDPHQGGTLYLHGAVMLVNRERFLELGGFDELFFYFEDNDLGHRAWRAGFHCWFVPEAKAHHLGAQTTSQQFKGTVNRRALKEKGNNLFVIKNVQNPTWLCNFIFWTALKSLAMAVRRDRQRWWAWRETLRVLPKLWGKRKKQPALDDRRLLEKVEALRP